VIKIPRDSHKGDRCFLVASGPSIKEMELDWLRDEITICVNESYKAFGFDPTYVCTADKNLWRSIKGQYAEMLSKVICSTSTRGNVGEDYSGSNLFARVPLDVDREIWRDGFTYDLEQSVPKGYNVVAEIALPFVCWCGFSECYLIGCDCTGNGYFYDKSIRNQKIKSFQRFVPLMMRSYETIAATEGLPTKIINATVGGNLDCFPRCSWPPPKI
jgi:hypothetical protein